MTSETDAEFVADMEWLHSHDREAALPPEKLDRLFALARRGAEMQAKTFTEGHCEQKKAPGGCKLHNLHCGYPDCDRRPLPPPPAGEQE